MFCTAFIFLGCENINTASCYVVQTNGMKEVMRASILFILRFYSPPSTTKQGMLLLTSSNIHQFYLFTLQNTRCQKRDPCSIIHNLDRWFCTWVRLNSMGSVRKSQGFGEERPNCHFSTGFETFFSFLYIWNKICSLHYPNILLFWSIFPSFFYIWGVRLVYGGFR